MVDLIELNCAYFGWVTDRCAAREFFDFLLMLQEWQEESRLQLLADRLATAYVQR